MGVYPFNVRRYAMLLRPNKAETVVFGCQSPGYKIVRSDDSKQNFSVWLPHRRGITVSLKN